MNMHEMKASQRCNLYTSSCSLPSPIRADRCEGVCRYQERGEFGWRREMVWYSNSTEDMELVVVDSGWTESGDARRGILTPHPHTRYIDLSHSRAPYPALKLAPSRGCSQTQ
ncbi:hypothetical protein BaRGS_00009234 [Batillaria attramentaria]|uniref:Uncharacterized protein n=1 Tax=Batillaria attramentaria TaxID=370345 RepID=A0ABD0LJV4_9CAEN